MSKIDRFEDIHAWQQARCLCQKIYTTTTNKNFNRDFGLIDQARRASVSVMANIAEGFGRKTDKDFANFLYMSKGSAMEVISHLHVAQDQDYITKDTFNTLRNDYEQIIGKLTKLIHYLQKSAKKNRPN
jgi:four helix bundle protein